MLRTIVLAAAAAATAFAAQAGDPAAGEKAFKKCAACHAVGADAKNKVGPQLNGVVGRVAGSADGFKYSDAVLAKKAEGFVWTPENLDAYLTNTKEFIAGNKMAFAGLKKPEERADVIAYLATFK
jgi:cytochrome c